MNRSIEFSAYGTRIKILGGPEDNHEMAQALRELADSLVAKEIPYDETDLDKPYIKETSAMFCEHANEVPMNCTCYSNCYCKSHTCKKESKIKLENTDLGKIDQFDNRRFE